MSLDIQAISMRASLATRGPWDVERHVFSDGSSAVTSVGPISGYTDNMDLDCLNIEDADADFVAHAREDIPALLDEIERLRGSSRDD